MPLRVFPFRQRLFVFCSTFDLLIILESFLLFSFFFFLGEKYIRV